MKRLAALIGIVIVAACSNPITPHYPIPPIPKQLPTVTIGVTTTTVQSGDRVQLNIGIRYADSFTIYANGTALRTFDAYYGLDDKFWGTCYQVFPRVTTLYRVTAINEDGETSASITITVI